MSDILSIMTIIVAGLAGAMFISNSAPETNSYKGGSKRKRKTKKNRRK